MPPAPLLPGVTLTQLAYAVAVDTHRHFGAAAAASGVTQPTLSMQLRKLEDALGAPLFDRTRTPVVPTEVGRRLLAQARAVLREAEALAAAAESPAGAEGVTGELRLGVIPTLAPYLLPPAVPLLRRRHPGLALVVEERLTDDLLDAVRRGALDAGLVASEVRDPALAVRALFHEPFVGYVGAAHRLASRTSLAARDLLLGDLWLLGDGHCLRTQAVQLCRQRGARAAGRQETVAGGVRFESGNLETLERLVEQGEGMTLLPALAAAALRTEAQRALLRRFTDPAPGREVRLVQHRERARRERLVSAALDVLLAPVPALLAAGVPETRESDRALGQDV